MPNHLLQNADRAFGEANPSLSLNLSPVTDYSTQMPFLNLVKTMRPWNARKDGQWSAFSHEDLVEAGHVDEHGAVRSVPKNASLVGVWDWRGSSDLEQRKGRFVLDWEGQGEIRVQGSARTVSAEPGRIVFDKIDGGTFWIEISSSRRADPIREMSLVAEEHLDLHEAGALFNPDWRAVIEDARQIRFMNWMVANASTETAWSTRPTVDDATWMEGVPVEVMVRLANEIGVEPWFTLPHGADDDYVRKFAEHVRDHLDPSLKAHVEYSNEAWNGLFPQKGWLCERALAEWGEDAANDYYAKRATEIALIWDDVFGRESDARLTHVLGAHTTNAWLTGRLLEPVRWRANEPGAYTPPHEVFDAVAATTYFGGTAAREPYERWRLIEAIRDPGVDAIDYLADRLRDPAFTWSIPYTRDKIAEQAEVADRYGLDLLAYEGGQHVHHLFGLGRIPDWQLDILTPFFTEFVRSPQMADLYAELWDVWADLGDGPFMQFGDVGAPSKWGSWALLESLEDWTPRAERLFDLNANFLPEWGEGSGRQFLQGVTLRGGDGDDVLTGTREEDVLIGTAGADLLVGGAGADALNGGGGEDAALFSGRANQYDVRREGDGWRVTGPDGSDFLKGIERLEFASGPGLTLETRPDDDGRDEDRQPGDRDDDERDGGGSNADAIGRGGFSNGPRPGPVELTGEGRGAQLWSVNPSSDLGRFLTEEHGEARAYTFSTPGTSAMFDGREVKSSYWSRELNQAGRHDQTPLAEDPLSAARAFGGVIRDADVRGTSFADRIFGGDYDDRFFGGGGGDMLKGRGGDDVLLGGDGDDVLSGGGGRDILSGGGGADRLRSGGGGDVFLFADDFGRDVVEDFGAGDTILTTDDVPRSLEAVARAGRGHLTLDLPGGDVVLKGLGMDDLSWIGVVQTDLSGSSWLQDL